MNFEQPLWLWLLLIVPALVVAYLIAQRRRSKYAVRFATLPMLEKVAPTRPGWRRHAPAFAFLAALTVLTIAIARPVADVRVPRERATVVVAMDISNSMAATDVEPNRFEVAKSAATEFVNSLPEQFNVGLVSFARTANVVAPPSTDHQATIDAINRLTLTDSTAIGEAVLTSLQAVKSLDADAATDPPPSRIVLLSDGGNTSGRPIDEAAQAASQAGVPVSTIAYGTPEGTVNLEGRNIPVPADAESLRGLADATSGSFYSAESDEELRSVYSDLQSSIGWTTEEREITNLVAGVALAVALLAGLASLLWFSRLP
ncbi:VWA domain-containing protein [Kribbella catacumbae]|uniref:VWA domain-containing protein n=1 Tax=Kribbella catacumbae TaxID=460086 RepID=UPI00037D28A4|nr:VWA domain-containing protein [Kribbella catacumbae]